MTLDIIISYDPPPIPGWEQLAWTAIERGAEGEPVGRGRSEGAAIADLIDALDKEIVSVTWRSGGAYVEVRG